jgi:hypothetical protein
MEEGGFWINISSLGIYYVYGFIDMNVRADDKVSANGIAHLKNVNNYLKTNIYSYLETSGGRSSNLYLNVVHFLNTSVN